MTRLMPRFHQFALKQLSGGCQKFQKFYELIEKLALDVEEQNCA